MSKTVFRNYDIKSIKNLLKEIGQDRYIAALENQGLKNHKPLTMKGFYVEFDPDTLDFNLYYRYPSRISKFIMPVLGYWHVPIDDWIRENKQPE